LMPQTIQDIARFLPFQMFRYVPIEILLNELPTNVIVFDFAMGIIWLVIALILFRWTWREGVKRYSAVGA